MELHHAQHLTANGLIRSAVLLLCAALAPCAFAASLALRDDYRSPRNKERQFRKSTRLIVLHTTEAHARSALNKLSERGEAHYCLTEQGVAYRIIDRDREAFHAGRSMWKGKEDCDSFSVGIEVVGYHDKQMPLVQLAALKELVDRLKRIYNLKDDQVVCHSHVAYGAPNTWYKRKHRGRKRCGMLFAMPSVRAKLGLKARPASDPDIKANRLIQADSYLNSVLYGSTDTMARIYGRGAAMAAAAKPGKPTVAKTSSPKPARGTPVAAKEKPAPRPQTAKAPPPVVKPPLVVPPEKTVPPAKATVEPPGDDDSLIDAIGLTGKFFRKKAKFVPGPQPAAESASETPAASGEVLPLPKNFSLGKPGNVVTDLESLAKLPGYTRGEVTAEQTPYRIAGAAWRSADTYYYIRGRIVTGDKIDEKSVEVGTIVFYRK